MSLYPEVMLAPTFAFTTTGGGFHDAVLTVSGTPYNVDVATGSYRMCLAPSATDFLRVLAATLTAAGAHGLTFTCTLNSSGLVVVAADGTFSLALGSQLSYLLGNLADGTGTSLTAPTRPKHTAFFSAHQSDDWSSREMLVGRETPSGSQYGVTSGQRYDYCETTFPFIPHTAAVATALGDELTPWHPDAAHVTSIGSLTRAAPWSVRDVLATALGKVVAYSEDFQTARSSTAVNHSLVSIAATDLAQPRRSLQEAGSQVYHRWTVRLLRQSEETRA